MPFLAFPCIAFECLCLVFVFVFVLSLSLLKFRLNLNLNQVFMGAHYCSLQMSSDCRRAAGDTGLILPGPGSLWRGAAVVAAAPLPVNFFIRQRQKIPPPPSKTDGWKFALPFGELLCVRASERACVRASMRLSVRASVRLSVRACI